MSVVYIFSENKLLMEKFWNQFLSGFILIDQGNGGG